MIDRDSILKVLNQISGIYLLMWGLFFILAILMVCRAKHLQPAPLLPLTVMAFSVIVGLRLAFIWFGLQFTQPGYLELPYYWAEIMQPSVIRPLAFLLPALAVHGLLYALGELRHLSKQPTSITFSTRLSVHLILSMTALTFATHWLTYRATLQQQREELNHYRRTHIRFRYHPEQGQKSHDAHMIFVPWEPF